MSVFHNIVKALESGEQAALATIITTTGSTPACAFSKMLILQKDSKTLGTVGGGCVEADVLAAGMKSFETHKSEIYKFHLTEDEFVQGLICGGTLQVLVEPLSGDQVALFQRIQRLTDDGSECVLRTVLGDGGSAKSKTVLRSPEEALAEEQEAFRKAIAARETQIILRGTDTIVLEPIAGAPRLILFGAGHVSRAVCASASAVGFRATVVDDREQYANASRFPAAKEILVREFDEVIGGLELRGSDYLVIATRGHRYDEEILERVVNADATYIGMIGSRRKVLTTYKRLMARGISAEALQRVYSPIGLEIGAAGPEEIAVSVVAELIAVRRNRFNRNFSKSAGLARLLEPLHAV